jgi:multidrug efflux pump subunit AcrA (membrane-fusion protein)
MTISRPNLAILALVGATLAAAVFLVVKVIAPAYPQPSNGSYTSRFGHLAMKRRAGAPFTVQTALVGERSIAETQLGEGRIAAEPIRVPVVPVGKIASVQVREGDRVAAGQLLATVDVSVAQFRLETARLELAAAEAELERVKLGSSYEMALERPMRENINLTAIQKKSALWKEKAASTRRLFEQGIISRTQYQEVQIQLAEAEKELQTSELGVSVSSEGLQHSAAIAESIAKEKKFAVEQRARELAECEIRAPAAGVIERVFIHAGEYNQEPGEPAFVIASGLWFEARLDQMAIHKVQAGDEATVHLEALPGRPLVGRVAAVVPIVTYHPGGPEASRPVRPMGAGAPEWPTTFATRIEFAEEDRALLVPGLTGFARIEVSRKVLAVPLAALSSVSSNSGLVHVLESDGLRVVRRVSTGGARDGWIEITDGLRTGEKIIVAGHEDLEPGDHVVEFGAKAVTAR